MPPLFIKKITYQMGALFDTVILILYTFKILNHTFYAHNAMKDRVFGFVSLKCNVRFRDISAI